VFVFWKSDDGNGTYVAANDVPGSRFSLGHDSGHQYNKFSSAKIKDLFQKKSLSYNLQDPAFSPKDVEYVQELAWQKVMSIQNLSSSQQRKIREQISMNRDKINAERKEKGLDELPLDIQYEHAISDAISEIIVEYHNARLDRRIDTFCYDKLHEIETQKVQSYTQEELDHAFQAIPQEKRSEIVQSLIATSQNIDIQKEDVQKRILAIFNTDAKKQH